jgi:flagellar motor protein MotB
MAKAKCKCKSAECEECPEWIFTFADLVMLMMGFFVILWVLKPPAGKEGEPHRDLPINVIAQIRIGFGYSPDPRSTDPIDLEVMRLLHIPHSPTIGGQTSIEPKGQHGTESEVQSIRPSSQVGMGVKVLFEPGDATLSADAKHSLDVIGKEIMGFRNIFMVKGHASTDDYPDGTEETQKMALSLRRAQAAADYLVSIGVSRDTLRVQGCSTYEPVVQRAYTGDLRSLNRRVEVEKTSTLVKNLQGDGKSNAAKTPRSEDKSELHPEH